MFLSKDEIYNKVNKIINTSLNNDIVFIIANKGFGKKQLLNEIYAFNFNRNIIVTNGENFHDNSMVKNCLMHGIYVYLNRNNTIYHRNFLARLISDNGKIISINNRIKFNFHVKLKCNELENLLKDFSINTLASIYTQFTSFTHIVFILMGTKLCNCDLNYLENLDNICNSNKFTCVIALRPNSKGVNLIKNIIEYTNEKIWMLPLMPPVIKTSCNLKMIRIPYISLNGISNEQAYDKFKEQIYNKNYYISVYNKVEDLLKNGINPSIIFTAVGQEISFSDFDYINLLSNDLLIKSSARPSNDALIAFEGKYVWIDTLVYYLYINEGIIDIILEVQNFYFSFLIMIKKKQLYNKSLDTIKRINKRSFIQMNKFLKKMSELSYNKMIPEITEYVSMMSVWILKFIKISLNYTINVNDIDLMINDLDNFNVLFSFININALRLISGEINSLSILDSGLKIIKNHLSFATKLTDVEVKEINSFITRCFNESFKWNDTTLIENTCDILPLLMYNKILDRYEIPNATVNHSMYNYLSKLIENIGLKIDQLITGRKTIFLSYKSFDKIIVDKIDYYLLSLGYDVKRDIRDIKSFSNIYSYMDSIREQDYVIPIISVEYLKSENCMYEISQLLKEKDYKKKTFPILIDYSKLSNHKYDFFSVNILDEVTNYWESKANNILDKFIIHNNIELIIYYIILKNYAQVAVEFIKWFQKNLDEVIKIDKSELKNQKSVEKAISNIDDNIIKLTNFYNL